MISDEKRREVAKNMREYDVAEFRESAIVPFLDCLGYGYECWRVILDTLADLIDRPTCKTIEHEGPDEFHVCKSCSRCSYGWFEDIHDKPYSYCPNCGAEVIEGGGAAASRRRTRTRSRGRWTPSGRSWSSQWGPRLMQSGATKGA